MTGQPSNITQTICNALWGHQLSFHPYTRGDAPVSFASLWPDKQTLVEAYRDANLEQAPYELCKLLLATNSAKSLDALLEEHVLVINRTFNPGNVTLAHLACTLGVGDVTQVLARRSQANNGIWSLKDDDEHVPIDVCFKPELRRILPGRSFFGRKKVPQGLPLKDIDKQKLFEMAKNTDNFYQVIVQLQMYSFDVNQVRIDGDLLIHIAIKGGLSQLPLLFALVRNFKANINLLDSSGLSPLCLACKLGEEKVAEVLVCVFRADVNTCTESDGKTPLHWAVQYNHPRVVSMLLRRGADASCEDKSRCVPSFVARRHRFHECRQIILQFQRERVARVAREAADGTLDVSRLYPSDSSIVTNAGCTLLMLATMNDRESTVRELTRMEQCPLDFKQMKSCDLFDSDSFSGTVSWGEDTMDTDHSLKTAVHMAAERGFTGCLQALLEAGAHPSISDASAWLPLHYACDNSYADCVNAIVTYPNQLGLSGLRPALDIARGNDYIKIVELLEKAIARRQSELVTPLLFEVAHSGNKDLLFAVLENGDDVNPTNEAHDWPLILAAGFGYIDLVTHLHEFGGHVTRKHKLSQSTPLHVASRGGHKEVVRYLLRFCIKADGSCPPSPLPSGANVDDHPDHLYINDRNTVGATPLELAVSQGNLEVVRLLLEHGASTTLSDSNGCQLNCKSFAGTQFLIETHRKSKRKKIMACLHQKATVNDLKKIWGGPSDFNLCQKDGDSLIMVAAQFAKPDVLKFLIESASHCKRGMLISPGQPLLLSGMYSSSAEESSDVLENSLPKDFKEQSLPQFPHTALPALRNNHKSYRRPAEVTVTSLGPMNPFGNSGSDPGDDDEKEAMLKARTSLPPVLRTQFKDTRHYPTDRGNSRRPPKKPPRSRQRTQSALPHPPKKSSSGASSATPTSDDEEHQKHPPAKKGSGNDSSSGAGPVANGYGGGSGAESGGETKGKEYIRLMHYTNPTDGRTALHRAADACQYDNVSVLLKADEELANMQDYVGNTALHLACLKAHKQTVKTILSFKCVDTVIRNGGNELPEERCVRRDVRKMVSKSRQAQVGDSVPDPPLWNGSPKQPRGMASVGEVEYPTMDSHLPGIPESPALSTVSDLTMPEYQARFHELKIEYDRKHDGTNNSN